MQRQPHNNHNNQNVSRRAWKNKTRLLKSLTSWSHYSSALQHFCSFLLVCRLCSFDCVIFGLPLRISVINQQWASSCSFLPKAACMYLHQVSTISLLNFVISECSFQCSCSLSQRKQKSTSGQVFLSGPEKPQTGARCSPRNILKSYLIWRNFPFVRHHPPQAGHRAKQGHGQPDPQVPLPFGTEHQSHTHRSAGRNTHTGNQRWQPLFWFCAIFSSAAKRGQKKSLINKSIHFNINNRSLGRSFMCGK